MHYLLFLLLTSLYSPYLLAKRDVVDENKTAIEQRIKPVGEVTINKGAAPAAATTTKTATTEAQKPTGEKTFQIYCTVCHKDGVAGAPKKDDVTAWQPRADKGITALVDSAIKGKGAMPPKGTCTSCTPDDIKAAILYMLPEKLKTIDKGKKS